MEVAMVLKALLSLVLVLGLMFLSIWAIKYLEVHSSKIKFLKKVSNSKRLDIIEVKKLDAKNSLMLVRRDKVEHLLLVGATNMVVEQNIKAKGEK